MSNIAWDVHHVKLRAYIELTYGRPLLENALLLCNQDSETSEDQAFSRRVGASGGVSRGIRHDSMLRLY